MGIVRIYTDGAARGNPDGPGGYGVVLQYVDRQGSLHEKELSCGYERTTNNRMELMAAIAGLEALNRPCQVELYSDSKYLTDAFNQHWIDSWVAKGWNRGKSGPVKNIDLWKRLLEAKKPHDTRSRVTQAIRKMSAATSWPPVQPDGENRLIDKGLSSVEDVCS